MLSWPDAEKLFGSLKLIIIDEIHTLSGTKRGDLLSLSLSALRHLATKSQSIGLSATVGAPERFRPWLSAQPDEVCILQPELTKAIELSILKQKQSGYPGRVMADCMQPRKSIS